MRFQKHYDLKDKHALLSPSQSAWINYDDNKLIEYLNRADIKRKGTELHEFAFHAIRLGVKLGNSKKTLNQYVNDAIGFKMEPEVILKYSDHCFGTADAISFRDNVLRIHDLKTGATPTKFRQLIVYAAIFCLEYKVKPTEIETILRIYQFNDMYEHIAEPEEIMEAMKIIINHNKVIEKRMF